MKNIVKKNLGFGVGLRSNHFPYLMQNEHWQVDWFEIISENFIDNYGYARHVLERVRSKKPIVMHGVSMNLGCTEPLNKEYLKKLSLLIHEIEPEWVSDHLCWTGAMGLNSHDLLPMPYTEESLNHIISRIHYVQDFLGRTIVLENPSSYLQFNQNAFTEWEFINEIINKTECQLLLDVNNVYVTAHNHSFCAETYIKSLLHKNIVQIHLAGPTNTGTLLIDTHDKPVPQPVWQLYKLAISLIGPVSTLLEWDDSIPSFETLCNEVLKAKNISNDISERYEQPVL